jgi:hypothetical protein
MAMRFEPAHPFSPACSYKVYEPRLKFTLFWRAFRSQRRARWQCAHSLTLGLLIATTDQYSWPGFSPGFAHNTAYFKRFFPEKAAN